MAPTPGLLASSMRVILAYAPGCTSTPPRWAACANGLPAARSSARARRGLLSCEKNSKEGMESSSMRGVGKPLPAPEEEDEDEHDTTRRTRARVVVAIGSERFVPRPHTPPSTRHSD